MNCVRNVSRVCQQAHAGTRPLAPATPSARPVRQHVRTAASGSALVVGGGFAGLAAADVLATSGLDVVLVEQGRGLGGRMCTRTVTLGSNGERVTFDHGCQYLTARTPLFGAVLEELQQRGALAQWGRGVPVGAATLAEDGTVDLRTFTADSSKALWVGCPTNSAVGRALAARAGPRLSTLTGTRVESLRWDPRRRGWSCAARRTAARGGSSQGDTAVATLQSRSFDLVVTAMSSVSTVRLLGSSISSDGEEAGSSSSSSSSSNKSLAPEVVAAADEVRSNVCWALMVAINKKIDVHFDGALLSRPDPSPDGGSSPQYGPIAWIARDSSKPGRPPVAGGGGEAWVVHAGPDWSNTRRDVAPADVAQELLRDFAHLVQTPLSPADVVHLEAHRWNNAYPLNPRPPHPPQLPERPAGEEVGGSTAAEAEALAGHFMLRPEMRLSVCGDWCKGPRAADAFVSGWEAATALLRL